MVESYLRQGHGNYIVVVKYSENAVTKKLGKSQYMTPDDGGIISTPGPLSSSFDDMVFLISDL